MFFQKIEETETASTAILRVIPTLAHFVPVLRYVKYESGGTAHTLTVMRCVAQTKTIRASLTSEAVLGLATTSPGLDTSGAPEQLTTADYVAWIDNNGQIQIDRVLSSTTSQVTLDNNFSVVVPEGTPVYAFYEVGRATHFQFSPAVSTTTEYDVTIHGSLPLDVDRWNRHDGNTLPLAIHSDNITAAGTLDYRGDYVSPSDVATT